MSSKGDDDSCVNMTTASGRAVVLLVSLFVALSSAAPSLRSTAGIFEGDDTAWLQAALANLTATGGVLTLEPRQYNITSTIAVPDRVTLQGAGFSTILFASRAFTETVVTLNFESGLRDIQFDQEQPDFATENWAPYEYDFTVRIQADKVTVLNILLLRAYQGIAVVPAAADECLGQVQLFNIRAHPFLTGLLIDGAADVVHVQQLHFCPLGGPAPQPVLDWTANFGTAIVSKRNDNPIFSQVFVISYKVGLLFAASDSAGGCSGITSKPKVSQFDCDFCAQSGVKVEGDDVRGVELSQFSFQGANAYALDGIALWVVGNGVTVTVAQADWTLCGSNCLRVDGSNAAAVITGSLVRSWNVNAAAAFPALEAPGDGSQVVVDAGFYGDGTSGADFAGSSVLVGATVLHADIE
jgi:hypothetical protein